MGNQQSPSVFTAHDLLELERITFFNGNQITEMWEIFASLGATKRTSVLPIEDIQKLKCLCVSPFKEKICRLFASSEDGLTFEDFLEMCSVFSKQATFDVKVRVMFHIFDKDDDGMLNEEDIQALIGRMVDKYMGTTSKKGEKDISIYAACNKLFEEADIDGNKMISMNEFKTLCENLPDFERKFSFRPEKYVS